MKEISLEEAKQLQFDMLKEVHRYCNNNNLKYYLYAGTLIGAIRHQGYIPWDDDIDIIMPKKDFEKFMNQYKSDRYAAIWPFNNKEHEFAFGRLYDKKTFHKWGRHKALGLFIDIYVIFGAIEDGLERRNHFSKIKKYSRWINRIGTVRRRMAKLNVWPFKTLNSTLINRLCKVMYLELSKYSNKDTSYIHTYGGGQFVVRKDLFEERTLVYFNGEQFYAPKRYDEFLRLGYGDYMQLPPEDERHPYHGLNNLFWT